jgi:GntR family transcriptional regulator / MocR family aminotransferase
VARSGAAHLNRFDRVISLRKVGVLFKRDNRSMRRSAAPIIALPAESVALNRRIYLELRSRISGGSIAVGSRLPSTRTLAADLNVSRNTALRAIEQLEADGWVESRPRSGIFAVFSNGAKVQSGEPANDEPPPVSFDPQRRAHDLFPWTVWARCVTKVAGAAARDGLTANPAGDPELRGEIAASICSLRGITADAAQIFIVSGIGDALRMTRAALSDTHAFAVDEPVLHQLSKHAAILTDSHTAERTPLRVTLASTRRGIDLGLRVEVDDLDHSLLKSVKAPAHRSAMPITILNFGGLLFEGCQLAVLIVPPNLADAFRAVALTTTSPCLLAQRTLFAFLAEGHFARHLRFYREQMAERRRAAGDVLKKAFGFTARDGTALRWPHLRLSAAQAAIMTAAGARLVPATDFDTSAHGEAMLGYAGHAPAQMAAMAADWRRLQIV